MGGLEGPGRLEQRAGRGCRDVGSSVRKALLRVVAVREEGGREEPRTVRGAGGRCSALLTDGNLQAQHQGVTSCSSLIDGSAGSVGSDRTDPS